VLFLPEDSYNNLDIVVTVEQKYREGRKILKKYTIILTPPLKLVCEKPPIFLK